MAMNITSSVFETITAATPRRGVFDKVSAIEPVELLRAIRQVRAEAVKRESELKAEIDKLKALVCEASRVVTRANELAIDTLRALREEHGPHTPTGMYKVDLNDGTFVSLIVTPSEAVVLDREEIVNELPDELCKTVRTPCLDLIKAQL